MHVQSNHVLIGKWLIGHRVRWHVVKVYVDVKSTVDMHWYRIMWLFILDTPHFFRIELIGTHVMRIHNRYQNKCAIRAFRVHRRCLSVHQVSSLMCIHMVHILCAPKHLLMCIMQHYILIVLVRYLPYSIYFQCPTSNAIGMIFKLFVFVIDCGGEVARCLSSTLSS